MPWTPLPRIVFAVATYPFQPQCPADLPLELGDELYIIEQGGIDGDWFRGYLVAPPSLLAGLTSVKGQTLEARVFSGIFPRSCVEVKEVLFEDGDGEGEEGSFVVDDTTEGGSGKHDSEKSRKRASVIGLEMIQQKNKKQRLTNGTFDSANFVRDPTKPKPPAPVPMLKIGDETPTSSSEPLVDEIASCLREWHSTNLHELLLSRQYPRLDKMAKLVQTLDLSRRQFLHNVLTNHELVGLREKTVWDLVRGNKAFNGEVIVRDPATRGKIMTGDDSAVEITKLQSMMSLLDERPTPPIMDNNSLHHLSVDVKAFVGGSTESTTLVLYLASKTPGQPAVAISESYIVEVPPSGALSSLAKTPHMRTIFTDLAATDIGDISASSDAELYLLVKVRSTHQVVAGKPRSRGGSVSRDGAGSRNGEKPTSSTVGKPGRRSLMWGQNAKRSAFSRNAPASKLDSLSESGESRDENHPPGTADSRGPATGERNGDVGGRKSSTISRTVYRTVGIGALKVTSLFKQNEECEQLITIWAPSSVFGHDIQDLDGWEEVIKDMMSSGSGFYEKSRRGERVQVQLRAFDNPDAETLVKSTPTLLSGFLRTSKMGFSGAPTKPRSDIYITIDEAFLPRHALLSRSVGSATPMSSSISGNNLQITLEVRKANGELLEGAIFPSSNSHHTSSWESTATERGSAWNETLKLCIPPTEVSTCHVMMTLADAPNQPFAICHMPLWDQGAFIRDGHHSLLLYRCDETTVTAKGREDKGGYLSVPWNARGKDDVSKDEAVTGPIATLRLQTYLCSTRFSQDKMLLGLLKWKEQSRVDLMELLKRLIFVPEIEIVKLLNDVFDAIFGILVENSGNDDFEDLVFSALVTVLGIVHDRRFNLGPLVDQYAENKFNYPFATPCLVRSFTRLLSNPSEPGTSRRLNTTFKVVRHILKFISHGRGQQKSKEADIGITTSSPGFTRHLRSIFKALDGLMKDTSPSLVGTQTLAVQHFHTWLPELIGLLKTEEIVHIAIDFLDSCSKVKGKLILYKLVLIINYSKLDLFSQPEQRSALAANTVRWLAPHWGKPERGEITDQWIDQVRLCCSILSTQINGLGPEIPDYIPKVIDCYLALQNRPKQPKTKLSLLFPTAYPFPSKPVSGKAEFEEVLVELSAILSAISTLPAGMQLELAEDEMAILLESTLQVHLSILQCESFPSDWVSVHIYHHKSTMKTLDYLAQILLDNFLPEPDDAENYNTELWKVFFTVLLKVVGSDSLALETFPEQKRRAVWKIAGDVREHGAALLRRTWEAIGWDTSTEEKQRYNLDKMGGYQVQYVPVLVGPIVELCLSVHEGLRRVAVEVLQTMIVSEWTLSEDLSAIQTEMIDCLDHLFKSKPLTESILQKLFINELMHLFEPLSDFPDDPLDSAIHDLVGTIDEFLDLLVAVHSTDVTGKASHMIHRLRLMEFLRDMQKEEIFIRYVHQLAQLQADARNPTEAGLALRLHADLYDWDPTKVAQPLVDPDFPAQSHFDRKERIYFDIIQYFEEGEAWSSALAAYQELQRQYEENVYDFTKLARTQRSIATIYDKITKSERLIPKYFKVIYRGMGFPPSLRDKEFVFEGSPSERTTAFTDRMQEIHPSAHIVTSGEIDNVEGQYLQISALSPHRDLESHVFQRARVPHIVRDYLLSAHPQKFAVTSKRTTTGPVEEHTAEKTIYTTVETFPTILRRSEIATVERMKMTPVQTAVERVTRKTQEMTAVEKRVTDGEDEMASLLIDALQISVNPTSESSVANYRALLPTSEPDEDGEIEEPILSPIENALKIALIDHAVMIKRCLGMLGKSQFRAMIGEVEREALAQNFHSSFAPELASYAFPQAQTAVAHSPTPVQSWQISPTQSTLPPLPPTLTNGSISTGTQGTDILDTPGARAGRNRLSFLKKMGTHAHTPSNGHSRGKSEMEAVLAPLTNINSLNMSNSNEPRGRGKSTDSQSDEISSRSRSKENRRSFFGTGPGSAFSSVGRGRGRDLTLAVNEKDEESGNHTGTGSEWVTQSDLSSIGNHSSNLQNNITSAALFGGENAGRRSSSSQRQRPKTSGGKSQGERGKSRDGSLGRGVGSVRKRFSMLKLGRKKSDLSGLMSVGSVAEE